MASEEILRSAQDDGSSIDAICSFMQERDTVSKKFAMSLVNQQSCFSEPAIEFHLLGRVDFDDCLALQHRLAYEAGGRDGGQIDVVLCEHPAMITIGRAGSRSQVRLSQEELKRRQLSIRWVGRGGGCVLHAPGQLAIYPIVPLEWFDWTVGEYLRRFRLGVTSALASLGVSTTLSESGFGVFGRSGPLAVMGVGVRNWTTVHGAFLNVNPAMTHYGFVDVCSPQHAVCQKTTMGCVVAERRRPVKMTAVRAALVEQLADSFGCQRYHLHTGHPLLRELQKRKETA